MDGHAENAPDTIDSLAAALMDTPEKEPENQEGKKAESPPDKATADDATAQSEEAEEEEESQEESESEEEEAKDTPTPERKLKIEVPGEDGQKTEVEVTEGELIKGYHRQADYTRKMQALAERETQAVQVFTQKHNELRESYLQQAELAKAAVAQLAGFRSDAEMADLASTDPAQWVQESQRQEQIRRFLGNLEQQTQDERTRAEQEAHQARQATAQQRAQKAWAELSKDGIDRSKLVEIYKTTSATYGFKPEEFASVDDPRLVRMMKDAAAYRELKSKAPAVTQKANEAPRMPSRQTTPAANRQREVLDKKFTGGRAKLTDLAALLM